MDTSGNPCVSWYMDSGGHPNHPSSCVCSACALFRITRHLCTRIDDLTDRQAAASSVVAQNNSPAKTHLIQENSATSGADHLYSVSSERTVWGILCHSAVSSS